MFRNLFKLIFLLTVMVGGAFGLHWWDARTAGDRALMESNRKLAESEAREKALQTYIENLKAGYRRADMIVINQTVVAGKVDSTHFIFVEYGPKGNALAPKDFTITGDQVHLDALLVKFPMDLVGKQVALKDKSLVLFYRLYGEYQAPIDGKPIDSPTEIPEVYRSAPGRTDEIIAFEEDLWKKVWPLMKSGESDAKLGVEHVEGVSPWTTLDPDHVFEVDADAVGALRINKKEMSMQMQNYRDAIRKNAVN